MAKHRSCLHLLLPTTFLVYCLSVGDTNAVPLLSQEVNSNETTTTETSSKLSEAATCLIGDVVYAMGDSIPASDSCERCQCSGSNKISCEPIQCTNTPGCRALQRSNQCCPDYICECKIGERTYDNGARIPEEGGPCQVCYCRGGSVQCAVLECFWRDDCEPRYESGKCCPKFDHCSPPAGSEPSSHPMNISAPVVMTSAAVTSDLPVVKFQQVLPSSSSQTLTGHVEGEHVSDEYRMAKSDAEMNTKKSDEEYVVTTPVVPRTPTQDGGLVTESAVETPSEPSSTFENLVSRSFVKTTVAPSTEQVTNIPESTDIPAKIKEDNVESRGVNENETTETSTVSDETYPETTTVISSEEEFSTVIVNTTEEHSSEEAEARFDVDPWTETSPEVIDTTIDSITTTDSVVTDSTNIENAKSTPETSTEVSSEPVESREHSEITSEPGISEKSESETTTSNNEETTIFGSDTIETSSRGLSGIQSRLGHDELHAIQDDKISENLETTTLQSDIDNITTENSVGDTEARTEETLIPTTDAANVSATDEIPTENFVGSEFRTEETILSTEAAGSDVTTTSTENVNTEAETTSSVETRTEPDVETTTPHVTIATISASVTTPENNKSVVSILHDSVVPAVNIDEESELVKNLSTNMDPAEENKKLVEENNPTFVEDLARSIERADFPFNTTQNDSSSTTTESPGYLFNENVFPDAEFVNNAEIFSPLSRPLAAPIPSYGGFNDWRIAPIQDASADSIPWRDEIDLAADPGAGADILILPWNQQQHLRGRRQDVDHVVVYVQDRMRQNP